MITDPHFKLGTIVTFFDYSYSVVTPSPYQRGDVTYEYDFTNMHPAAHDEFEIVAFDDYQVPASRTYGLPNIPNLDCIVRSLKDPVLSVRTRVEFLNFVKNAKVKDMKKTSHRRIQTARTTNYSLLMDDMSFSLHDGALRYAGYNKTVQFARRPFAGAERLIFTKYGCINGLLPGFRTNPGNYDDIWLCIEKCQSVLNIGKRTKKFSLWVKKG